MVSPDLAPTVAFGPDGIVEGFGGCNHYRGGYSEPIDAAIAIGPLMSTMQACSDTIDAQETAYLTALQNATMWSISAGTLALRDARGSQQVAATSAIGH